MPGSAIAEQTRSAGPAGGRLRSGSGGRIPGHEPDPIGHLPEAGGDRQEERLGRRPEAVHLRVPGLGPGAHERGHR